MRVVVIVLFLLLSAPALVHVPQDAAAVPNYTPSPDPQLAEYTAYCVLQKVYSPYYLEQECPTPIIEREVSVAACSVDGAPLVCPDVEWTHHIPYAGVSHVMVTRNGDRAYAFGESGGLIRISALDAEDGTQLWHSRISFRWVDGYALSADESTLYIAGADSYQCDNWWPSCLRVQVGAVDAATGEHLWSVAEAPEDTLRHGIFVKDDPSGEFVIVGSTENYGRGRVAIHYSSNGTLVRSFDTNLGPYEDINAFALTPDGSLVLAAGRVQHEGKSAHVIAAFDPLTGDKVWKTIERDDSYGAADCIRVATDSQTVFVAGEMQRQTRSAAYDVATGDFKWESYLGSGSSTVYGCAISTDGARFAVIDSFDERKYRPDSSDARTSVVDTDGGAVLWEQVYAGAGRRSDLPLDVAFSEDDRTVLVTGATWGRGYVYGYHGYWMTAAFTVAYATSSGMELWSAYWDEDPPATRYGSSIAPMLDHGRVLIGGPVVIAYDTDLSGLSPVHEAGLTPAETPQ